MLFGYGFFSPKMWCGQGLYHFFFLFFFPRLFFFVVALFSSPCAMSMFCDYRIFSSSFFSCLFFFFFFFFFALYKLTKHFSMTVKLTKQTSGSKYSQCQMSYIHKPVRGKPRREDSDVQHNARLR